MEYFQDIPQAEVADLLEISQMQVSRRLKKATAALQELMSGNGTAAAYTANRETEKTTKGKRVSRSSLGARLQAQQQVNNP